jgi:hypothetical protein
MKIGIISSGFRFPPREGVEIQLVKLIDELRGKGHDVELVGINVYSAEVRERHDFNLGGGCLLNTMYSYKTLSLFAVSHIATLGLTTYLSPQARFLRKKASSWLESKDAIYIQGVVMAWLPYVVGRNQIFWGPVDSYSLRSIRFARYLKKPGKFRALFKILEKNISLYLEATGIRSSRLTYVCGYSDARYLSLVHKTDTVLSIPLLGLARNESCTSLPTGNELIRRVVVWADYRVEYLKQSALNCLSELSGICDVRGLQVVVLGKGSKDLMKVIPAITGVFEFHEWVDGIEEFLSKSMAVVLPDEVGTGIKNRTLYAMGLGCVTVGKFASFQSIPALDRVNCMRLRSWAELADVFDLLDSKPDEINTLRENAITSVTEYCSEAVIIDAWVEFLSLN